jgi:hypothetical protein
MSQRNQKQRPPWKIAIRAAVAAFAACAPSFPVSAESDGRGPVEAAFYACAGQPVSIKTRLEALNAANWVIAGDSPAVSNLFALAFASRFKYFWVPGEGRQREAALAGENGPPLVSRVEPTGSQDEKGAKLIGGEPANVDGIVRYAKKFRAQAVLYYASADETAVLRMLLLPTGTLKTDYFVNCDLYLSAPLTDAEIESYLPANLKSADLRKERKRLEYEALLISYSTTSGYMGKLTYVDADDLAKLKAHLSRFGSAAVLSAIIGFESRNIPLTN